ncbi:aromatic ring-hydroxylating dioxygenase subunit alpha [Macromonas nakdongensis]|uniref:aromatic ring-hydroxylating dioxygenase subunit alpha n=1 Tax=Macromonas nakdongensis TaxID=1843082 RepID=UPI000C330133|nr:aromatic ring-hydroxylating dioxygenase subunit alpha [Macromonas nakdongensis]
MNRTETGQGPFLRQAWYAAASSDEVGAGLLARTLLNEPVLLYRLESGEPVALLDRCAHRFAPLSLGRRCGDEVVCPYHGMRYGPDGVCTQVPGQATVPARARVHRYPTLERYGLVFVWMGDPARADARHLVSIAQYGQAGWGLSRGHALFHACLDNILDNLIDPAHTTYVHPRTIGSDAGADVAVQAELEGADTLVCGRWVNDAPAVPMVQRFAPPDGPVDRWQFYRVRLPCTSWVDFGSLPAGSPHTPEAMDAAPYRVISYAFLTPQDAEHTHYFSFQLRNFAADDGAVTAEFNALYRATFDEDRVLLEAIQREERRAPGTAPTRIASDAGVARLRRMAHAWREAEQPHATAAAPHQRTPDLGG